MFLVGRGGELEKTPPVSQWSGLSSHCLCIIILTSSLTKPSYLFKNSNTKIVMDLAFKWHSEI